MTLIFDILLITVLLWLAWGAVKSPDLFKGVVLFIAFGLLLALAWVRLRAPDIALAEAAIGSGLTGALFLSTLGRLKRMDQAAGPSRASGDESRAAWTLRLAWGVSLLVITALMGWAVYGLPREAAGLADAVQEQIAVSGASNPVTSVLLNFRAYDTLLEIGVLLLAIVGVWSLAHADTGETSNPEPKTQNQKLAAVPLQQSALVNLLAPVMLVTAGYLLWIGATAPGGAFQAGAVLGGAGVLLLLSRPRWAAMRDRWWLRLGLALGLAVFLAVGLLMLWPGRRLLEYPVDWAGALILLIETAATISIGLTLALLFLGGRPAAANSIQPRVDSHPHE
jgi:multisubunit Na+/H+ antiporter MnhB subunit